MSKYELFGICTRHGGFAEGLTVVENDRLICLLPEFKQWFADIDGFGTYLRSYFEHYDSYFDLYAEEHALIYSKLHKEFSLSLEESIDQWLSSKGLTEDAFGDMMQQACRRGDHKSDEIVGVLLGMLDYQLWIANIFELKRSRQLGELLTGGYQAECSTCHAGEGGFAGGCSLDVGGALAAGGYA
eukprot:gb/GFBE01015497.1/.p1 GENE.gb/GFBE01015497.1/~~gb/GFBE01015497.1/.p1  ORF type:complete len:185 (+),score=44.92 gb/GFBE01015497.1/:1-555(+)